MIDEVKEYYNKMAESEWNRLNNPYAAVEFKSTVYLIDKYFPKKGHLLDVGSGPGRYSLELLKKGYKVSLLDISNNELDIARRKITEAELKAENYYCKSALELGNFKDESFDGILVMGPLYHMHNEEDRMKVLTDTYRILKKEGIALISYINTWGCLKAGISEFPESFQDIDHFERYINGNLKFSPEESFVSGMRVQMSNLFTYMPDVYEKFVLKAVEYCELPQYREASEHLHIMVKK